MPITNLVIMRGKRVNVMQMDAPIIDFIGLCENPFLNDCSDPYAVAVLLETDLVILDLLSLNFAPFENPYPMDLNLSPVTSIEYLIDCPGELISALYSLNSRSRRIGSSSWGGGAAGCTGSGGVAFTTREWPINGGEWGTTYSPYQELIFTG
ncbi:unnamed protein product [Protopolystoma xenopodis]|uniref:Lethal giant larvae homologue 2 domain-containing protein n=1 Tax=Protopolystoma xenopodis TaxID=117903 RepID=A0A3S5AXK1_9PLAT|nr:unnamed protein product [Protopolystoma xenopodis]